MKKQITLIILLSAFSGMAQKKINVDSLLTATNHTINVEKDYTKALTMAYLGKKLSPTYLDYHIAIGRIHRFLKQKDSAAYYFNYVAAKNPRYKEAFLYTAQMCLEQKDTACAGATLRKGLEVHPNDKDLELLKLRYIQQQQDDSKTLTYLEQLHKKYPNDEPIKAQLLAFQLVSKSDRISVAYNYTGFNRAGVGPWNYTSMSFIRQRPGFSLIGRYNYANRVSYGQSKSSGSLYELDAYVRLLPFSYSYFNAGMGNENFFPKLRLSYSGYINYKGGWESEIGLRYNKSTNNESYSGILGASKYLGNGFLNLRTFFRWNEKPYPSFNLTYRLYGDNRFNFWGANMGYGTSPDEREVLPQFAQRATLKSYKAGLSYSKVFYNQWIVSANSSFNRQEYFKDKFQNEVNISLQVQYQL
ncbi:MAG: hypothetical protein RLZZ500_2431 [Bacteroidota bacterium]|jgi:YaiO family outer membrane protein